MLRGPLGANSQKCPLTSHCPLPCGPQGRPREDKGTGIQNRDVRLKFRSEVIHVLSPLQGQGVPSLGRTLIVKLQERD